MTLLRSTEPRYSTHRSLVEACLGDLPSRLNRARSARPIMDDGIASLYKQVTLSRAQRHIHEYRPDTSHYTAEHMHKGLSS